MESHYLACKLLLGLKKQGKSIFSYYYLLIEIGTKLLRQLFEVKVGHDFAKYLVSNTTEAHTLQNLITSKKITSDQTQYLPPVDMRPDSSNFNSSLLTCLLRNMCGLKPPWDPVWMNPSPTDTSEEADITRLRLHRNWLLHSGTVTEADLTVKWNDLSQTLVRLNHVGGIPNTSSLTNDAEKMAIDAELYETLKQPFFQAIEACQPMETLFESEIEQLKHGEKSFRYQYLLIEIGTAVLRRLFDKFVSADLGKYLNDNQDKRKILQQLSIKKVLRPNALRYLPPIDDKPKSSNFSMLLLITLLRNICGLSDPSSVVWKNPAPADLSLEADISRLKRLQINLMYSGKLSDENFHDKWQESSMVLLRLNKVIQHMDIDNVSMMRSNEASDPMDSDIVGEMSQVQHSSKHITEETENMDKFIFRYEYMYLLIEIGTQVLQRIFDTLVQNDFGKYLSVNNNAMRDVLMLSRTGIIACLFKTYLPPIDPNPQSSNFDIHVLCCLLRNVCGLRPSNDRVWVNPNLRDDSVEADIARLKDLRNMWNHADSYHTSETIMGEKWYKLCEILHRLNRHARMTDLPSKIVFAEQIDINDELQTDRYIFRYDNHLVVLGTKVLRAVFDQQVGNDFGLYLARNQTESARLEKLIRAKIITTYQKQFLPPIDYHPNAENFEMTLLTLLLRNVCGLRSAKDRVWLNPAPTDVSVEADITRLQICRKSLSHIRTVYIHEAELTAKWMELRAILMRLNIYAKIANLQQRIEDAMLMDKVRTQYSEDEVGSEIDSSDNSGFKTDDKSQLRFTETDRKIFQLRFELIELGTAVLQKHFDYRVGNDFAKYLTSHEAEETTLQWLIDTNRITILQVKFLPIHKSEQTILPPSDQTPSSSYMYADNSDKTFQSLKSPRLDISLLTVLLRHICGLRAPNDLVWKEPPPMDMSIEADISRLGQCRNSIMTLKHLDEEIVDELGKKLREILTRLGRRVGITDDFFSSTGDAKFDDYHDDLHMNMDMLEEWYDNDQRQIQFGHGYAPKIFFKDSDDEAWTRDGEKVSVLLSEGILPNTKQLKNICEQFGSSSPTVRKVCAYICNTLQMTSHHITRCWPAYVYDKHSNNINLVTFVAVKDIEDKLDIDQIFGYNILVYELFHGSNRGETSEMMDHDIENAKKFNDEMDKIEKYVSDHSLSLMHNHSNITLIAGSTVKSKRYMCENKEIIENPCVVIYVHKKGYIPLGEKPFPTKLCGFDTDVRECVISLFGNDTAHKHNDNLLMGTSISNHDMAGTLGGFVEHSRYGLCGLTCAHVLCGGHLNRSSEVQHWSPRDTDVFQPALSLGTPIGKVECALLRIDDRVGIDIALFSIVDRYPISGQFAIDAPAGLNRNEYNSGNVLPREDIQRGAIIIKYGSETGRTETQVVMRSSRFIDGGYTLNKQLLVKNKPPHEHFAVKGDSGALSFIENDNGLHAMGVVVGGDPIVQTCCLTPLSDILDALSEDNTVQVTMKDFNVPGEPMQE